MIIEEEVLKEEIDEITKILLEYETIDPVMSNFMETITNIIHTLYNKIYGKRVEFTVTTPKALSDIPEKPGSPAFVGGYNRSLEESSRKICKDISEYSDENILILRNMFINIRKYVNKNWMNYYMVMNIFNLKYDSQGMEICRRLRIKSTDSEIVVDK